MSDERKPGGIILTDDQLARLTGATPPEPEPVLCNEPAPAVANGGKFVGCALLLGHDDLHAAVIRWGRTS